MSAQTITTIGFDADDTLWHNEDLFTEHHRRYCELLSEYHDPETVERTLYETEMRNLADYGYGIKSFMLSSIETAIALTEGAIRAEELKHILEFGRTMLRHPVELLDGVEDAIQALDKDFRLVLITKGDLLDQERKIEASGLSGYFEQVEVVSRKTAAAYQRALGRMRIDPQELLMVGNSLKSDIIPILELGGHGVHIPYVTTWEHERVAAPPTGNPRFHELESMADLPNLVARLGQRK